ncbi:19537_t:CDS:2 [Cetraspora pellucida]|uniref:19537_t:CDS:1 n=1 Tax=Cetraspora pellucida TaxID=1433469 RepID=A0A9N9DLI2_9GLOM|nr:19537_t:CDS:2 [Cetraspora pellucida]
MYNLNIFKRKRQNRKFILSSILSCSLNSSSINNSSHLLITVFQLAFEEVLLFLSPLVSVSLEVEETIGTGLTEEEK